LLITLSVGRALDYRLVIDDFVAKNKDLRKFEMHAGDWDAIALVAQWLKSFRSATTQMSTTKRPMLSSTHAIYRGLQESLRESLRNLPNNTPSQLKLGLTRAHHKLSDYYNKIDDSPYYIWSSCLLSACFLLMLSSLIDILTVLDPRISYQGLLADCEDNASLQSHLELSRNHLHAFYRKHYANTVASIPSTSMITQPPVTNGSPQKFDFTARYNKRARAVIDELDEYFKLQQESFELCDPIQWWAGRRAQFPNLSRLAQDILSIPGKYLVSIFHLLI